ncbi:AAA family ATPase, partial [candidate division CSSED10-310 bacterium]
MQKKRVFRVFVSSTFADLKEERNALQRLAFPRLRELCEEHGCHFQAIDLRWGIREQAALNQQTMKICLNEIIHCQTVTPRPNFIVLLGDRYGWCPLPSEIPQDEFDAIVERTPKDDQREMLLSWYRRDDNAVPPVYCLQSRTGEFVAQTAWAGVERRIRRILLNAAEELFEENRLLKYVASATHQEVALGALNVALARRHVFGFFRQIENLDELVNDLPGCPGGQAFVDIDERGCLDVSSLDKQRILKKVLRNTCSGRVFEYRAQWVGDGVSILHLETLCQDVVRSLSHVILDEINLMEEVTPLEQEIGYHVRFGEERATCFVGRETVLRRVTDYLRGTETYPLVVFGPAGCGKSALLARVAEDVRTLWPRALLIKRFVGATPASSNLRALLDNLSAEISHLYKAERTRDAEDALREDLDYLSSHRPPTEEVLKLESDSIQWFVERMNLARPDRPLMIFLDAIDQLSYTTLAADSPWLPVRLPAHVRLVVSMQPGPNLEEMQHRLPAAGFCELDVLDPRESERLLSTWLREAERTLQGTQEDLVRTVFRNSGLPLHLRLVFEEVLSWSSWSDPGQLPSDTRQLIQELFARLCTQHGALLVSRSLGYLSAAKEGLTEEELLDLLARDEEFFSDFLAQAHHDLPDVDPTKKQLPVAVWSRLFFDLEPYLMERGGDRTQLLTFYHRELGLVAAQEFLAGSDKEKRHRSLAAYFREQPLWKAERQLPNSRKLTELPFHQTHGALLAELETTICDLQFLKAKCEAGMPYALLDDYED